MEIISFNMSSFSEWEKGAANRNRHLFYKLMAQPEVKRMIAVDFLPFSFKRMLRNFWQNILFGTKGKMVYHGLFTRCVKKNYKDKELYVFSTIESFFFQKKVIKRLNQVLDKINSQSLPVPEQPTIRLVWSCFPMFKDYFKLKADLFVFDAVDNWLLHPSFQKYQEVLKKNYEIISEKSDLIFTVSENLLDFFQGMGRKNNLFWISNGVKTKHFNKKQAIVPGDLEKIKPPLIGYVGIIQQRVDVRLLEYLAQKNPDKSFVLIGPLWPVYFRKLRRPAVEIKRLRVFKNIYLLGAKKYKDIPDYINSFDLCFCPHRLDEFIKSTSSLKVLEYLAAGKPVVSTPGSSVEKFSHLVRIAQDYEEFHQKINQALKEETSEMKKQRKQRIKEYDWDNKVKEIMKIIKKNIYG